jgi:hypothetical protein
MLFIARLRRISLIVCSHQCAVDDSPLPAPINTLHLTWWLMPFTMAAKPIYDHLLIFIELWTFELPISSERLSHGQRLLDCVVEMG